MIFLGFLHCVSFTLRQCEAIESVGGHGGLPDAGDQVSRAEGSPVLSPRRSHGFLELEEYSHIDSCPALLIETVSLDTSLVRT